MLCVSPELVADWEEGRAVPLLLHIPGLCAVYGVAPEDLLEEIPPRRTPRRKR